MSDLIHSQLQSSLVLFSFGQVKFKQIIHHIHCQCQSENVNQKFLAWL